MEEASCEASSFLLLIIVEPLTAFPAEVPGRDHPPQERRRRHGRIFELVVEDVRDVEIDVEPCVVEELERAHRMA